MNALLKMDKKEYQKELKIKQEDHLKKVRIKKSHPLENWRPCLHDNCEGCCGTGIKLDGAPCIHWISCNCPKCSPSYLHNSRTIGHHSCSIH